MFKVKYFLLKNDGVISAINKTNDFSIDLLYYLMLYDMDAQFLYGSASRHELQVGMVFYNYQKKLLYGYKKVKF